MGKLEEAPVELADAIREFWTADTWDNAAAVAELESRWNAFAEYNSTSANSPCGTVLRTSGGVRVTAEWSIGWFQINACNLPQGWNPCHLFNTRHNVGTAHDLYTRQGWGAWYFSAKQLGLL